MVAAASSSSSSSNSNSSSTPAAALWHRDDVIWLAALSTWARAAFPGRACGGGAAISTLTGVLVAAGCSVSDAMLVLRKEGMKRSRGGLLACLQHDSKLRMLKRERGEADDQAEGGHGDGDGVEEGGGRGDSGRRVRVNFRRRTARRYHAALRALLVLFCLWLYCAALPVVENVVKLEGGGGVLLAVVRAVGRGLVCAERSDEKRAACVHVHIQYE